MTKKVAAKPDLQQGNMLLVLGQDEGGKPKGALFPAADMETVFPVAEAMKLVVHQPYTEHLAELGRKLPAGRVYARGKAFIPNIRRDLYDELQAEIAKAKADLETSKADRSTATQAQTGSEEPMPDHPAAKTTSPAGSSLPSGLPLDWRSIGAGHMVLAHESHDEGWWEAIVVAREDEILTLRYRDYPKAPKFNRHITTVALINPEPA